MSKPIQSVSPVITITRRIGSGKLGVIPFVKPSATASNVIAFPVRRVERKAA